MKRNETNKTKRGMNKICECERETERKPKVQMWLDGDGVEELERPTECTRKEK